MHPNCFMMTGDTFFIFNVMSFFIILNYPFAMIGHPLLYYSLKILEENGFKNVIVTGSYIRMRMSVVYFRDLFK